MSLSVTDGFIDLRFLSAITVGVGVSKYGHRITDALNKLRREDLGNGNEGIFPLDGDTLVADLKVDEIAVGESEGVEGELENDVIPRVGCFVAVVELREIIFDRDGISLRECDQMFRLSWELATVDGAFPLTGISFVILEMEDVEAETVLKRSTPRKDLDFFKSSEGEDDRMGVCGGFIKLEDQARIIPGG